MGLLSVVNHVLLRSRRRMHSRGKMEVGSRHMMSRCSIKETLSAALPDGIRSPVVPLSRLSTAVCEM